MIALFLAFIPRTFALKAQLLGCPQGDTYQESETLSQCTITGPKNQNFAHISRTGSLVIENSLFTNFNHVALDLYLSVSILFFNTKFQGFTSTYLLWAIKVSGTEELRLDTVEFDDFKWFAPFSSSGASAPPRAMFTLFGVKCTNIDAPATYSGLFVSAFEYLYAEGLTFTNVTGPALFESSGSVLQTTPVFRDLVTDSVTLTSSQPGVINNLEDPVRFFVIQGAIFKNTDNTYATHVTIYMEGVQFIEDDGKGRVGIEPNGPLSIIGCNFQGFGEAVHVPSSDARLLICASNFTDCATGIYYAIAGCDVVNSVFSGYTECAIRSVTGGDSPGQVLRVQGCVFLDPAVLAIQCKGWIVVNQSCFSGEGTVIRLDNSRNVRIGGGCCFKAEETVAIELNTDIQITKEEGDSPFGCTDLCTASKVSFAAELCEGYAVDPHPTVQITRSYVIRASGEIPEATQVVPDAPTPPTATLADATSQTIADVPTPPTATLADATTPPTVTIPDAPTPPTATLADATSQTIAVPLQSPTEGSSIGPSLISSPVPVASAVTSTAAERAETPAATRISFLPDRTGGSEGEGQAAGAFGAGAAAGVGVAALAAIAGVGLLLFFLRKKKNPIEEPVETVTDDTTVEEDDHRYISEYGLSDGGKPIHDDEPGGDRPKAGEPEGDYNEEIENASENNPEELEGEVSGHDDD